MSLTTATHADHYCCYCNMDLDNGDGDWVKKYHFDRTDSVFTQAELEEADTEETFECLSCGDGNDVEEGYTYYVCDECGESHPEWHPAASCCGTLCEGMALSACDCCEIEVDYRRVGWKKLVPVVEAEADDWWMCVGCHQLFNFTYASHESRAVTVQRHVCSMQHLDGSSLSADEKEEFREANAVSEETKPVVDCTHYTCPVCKRGFCPLHNCQGVRNE